MIRIVVSAITAGLIGVGGLVVNVSPALAVSQPVQKATKVAATPLAQKPEQHQAVAPVATPVSHPAPVQPKVAAPVAPPPVAQPPKPIQQAPVAPVVKSTPAPTQPVIEKTPEVVHPIDSAPPPPVKKVDEGQKPVATPVSPPAPVSVKGTDKGKSEHVASTPAPVQSKKDEGKTSQPTVAETKVADKVNKAAESCNPNQKYTYADIHMAGNQATATFDIAAGCHVTVSLVSYAKTTAHEFLPQVLVSSATGDFGPGNGQHLGPVDLPNNPNGCSGQIDLAFGKPIVHLGAKNEGGDSYYGDNLMGAHTFGNGACGSQTPPPVPTPTPTPTPTQAPPPVVVPTPTPPIKPTPMPTPPIKPTPMPTKPPVEQTPKPTSKPPVAQSPKVTVPVNRHPQARQPRLVANHVPAAVKATPTSAITTPLAPNAGTGGQEALPNQLAATGSNELIAAALAGLALLLGVYLLWGRRLVSRIRGEEQSSR